MSARVGVFVADERLRVTSWDPWMEAATGVAADAAQGRPVAEVLPELDKRGLLRRLERVISEGSIEVFSGTLHRRLLPLEPEGRRMSTAAPLRRDDKIVGLIFVVEDEQAEDASLAGAYAGLKDPDWQARRAAVTTLARGGDPAAVETLLLALQENYRDLSVVTSALQVLGMLKVDLIEPLCRLTRSPEAELRMYAATTLGDHGDARAAPCLLELLADADVNVRFHAVEALGKLRAPQAVAPLVEQAVAGDFFLSFAALDALARIGDPLAVPPLLPLLERPDLRAEAARVLGELGDESVVAPLARQLAGPDAAAAAQALARLHERYERRYGEGADVRERVRRSAPALAVERLAAAAAAARGEALGALTRALGWLEGAGAEAALETLLSRPDARKAAVEALSSRGRRAAESLRASLERVDHESRRDHIMALGRIGGAESVPALVELLSSDADTVIVVLEALGKIGDARALEPALELLDHPSGAVRLAAVAALNSLGRPELEERVERLLSSRSPRERQSAVRIAGYFGWPRAFDAVLRAAASDADGDTRKAALEVLPFFGNDAAPAALSLALGDADPAVRAAAARGLEHCGAGDAAQPITRALADPDPWVRYYAARAAGALRLADAAPALASLAERDPSIPVRASAALAYGAAAGPAATRRLAALVGQAELDLAAAAMSALGRIGGAAAVEAIAPALGSPQRERRRAALRALAETRQPAASEAVIRRALDAPETVEDAVEALAELGGARALAGLLALCAAPGRRELCAEALARAARGEAAALASGLGSPDPQARRTVVAALRRMKTPEAAAALARALDDADAAVRADASAALEELGSAISDAPRRR